jgi:transcriptional regulator with XRE-family HTH domain
MAHDKKNGYVGTRQENDYLAGVDAVAGAKGSRVEPGPDLSVGQRVAQVREQKGLSLEDVAKRTGLAVEALSEIESGDSNPPLGVLVRLGKALDMKLGTLIATGEDRPYTVVRVSDRQDMSRYPHTRETSYGYSYQALAPQKRNRNMEPFLVTLRTTGKTVEPSAHDGQEFIFVLDGALEAVVGDAVEVLEPGDSIYYDSNLPHLLRPHGPGTATIVAVIYSQDR